MNIYVLRGREQQGPFSLAEINARLAAGTFLPSDLAWPEGATQWMPLDQVPGIHSGHGVLPVPVAPPVAAAFEQGTEPDRARHGYYYSTEARRDRNEAAQGKGVAARVAMVVFLVAGIILGVQGHGVTAIFCFGAAVAAWASAAHFHRQIVALDEPTEAPAVSRGTLATFNAWLGDVRMMLLAFAVFGFLGISIYRDIKVSRTNYNAIHYGMTKAEVRAILGNPTDVTETTVAGVSVDMWTYAAGTMTTSKVILIDFENGRVTDKTWGGGHL